ncbi:hypothetical protein DEO72_LG7g2256 [Vigna unguiculata]|uniref:Uncharacterized protein n=1 Tax=Vigna unguiculata TaxID=3917 RepID=A0A4D6MMH4_VIGUN|nr:hypothetical protein DEO72_LG7g2256 [Vigna unguiculata]
MILVRELKILPLCVARIFLKLEELKILLWCVARIVSKLEEGITETCSNHD